MNRVLTTDIRNKYLLVLIIFSTNINVSNADQMKVCTAVYADRNFFKPNSQEAC